jgi:hypothetical protein
VVRPGHELPVVPADVQGAQNASNRESNKEPDPAERPSYEDQQQDADDDLHAQPHADVRALGRVRLLEAALRKLVPRLVSH